MATLSTAGGLERGDLQDPFQLQPVRDSMILILESGSQNHRITTVGVEAPQDHPVQPRDTYFPLCNRLSRGEISI